jgi:nitroreductase
MGHRELTLSTACQRSCFGMLLDGRYVTPWPRSRDRIAAVNQRMGRTTAERCFLWTVISALVTKGIALTLFQGLARHGSSAPRASNANDFAEPTTSSLGLFDEIVLSRYSCKKFKRSDGTDAGTPGASKANSTTVRQALECLNLSRQAPSANNVQPYKLLLVHSRKQREAMSRFCLGPNSQRVLDSDCTALFLADKQVCKLFPAYRSFVSKFRQRQGKPMSLRAYRKAIFYITVFSSGYPLPRVISAIISFLFRTAMSILNMFSSWFYPLPTLASSETWSSKQALMVAMTYMLACSSRGFASIPMEGINSAGLRRVLNIPSRYAIPLIVCTGTAFQDDDKASRIETAAFRRYPLQEVVYENEFGKQVEVPTNS